MDVMCLGLMVCDILVKPVVPENFKNDSSCMDFIKMSSGGDAFNVAVNLKKLGVDSGIIGKVGDDGFGRFLLETADVNGIDTSSVIISKEHGTSASVVMINPAWERHFAFYGGATNAFSLSDISLEMINNSKILFIGSAVGLPSLDGSGLAEVLRYAKSKKVITAMDITGNPDKASMELLKPALLYVDIFLPSLYEAKSITGKNSIEEIATDIMEAGVKLVVIKDGGNGCHIFSKDESVSIPAFRIDAVDTTGAGDAFVSGFLTGYKIGWSLYECGRFANATGALCALEAGATTGVKSFEKVMDFMNGNE